MPAEPGRSPSRQTAFQQLANGGTSRQNYAGMAQVAQFAQAHQTSPAAPVPPQNLEAEESVLGAMMISPGAIGAVSEVRDASDF